MKWETARLYVRGLIGRPHDIAERSARIDIRTALGPAIDWAGYMGAIALGARPGRGQVMSFVAAVALGYVPWLRAQGRALGVRWGFGLCLQLLVVTLLAFFLRGGVFVWLWSGWGWPSQAALGLAAIATAAMILPGYGYCVSYPKWELGSGAGWRAGAIGVVAVTVALRLLYAGRVELMPEEAYYWNYARHLDIGYLDHPPMVGWLIGAGTLVFGTGEFGVRAGALCCGAIAAFFMYRLTRNLFGEAAALVAVVLMQTLPFFFLTGLLMTPDAPLAAAWAGALYFLERALLAGRAEGWWRAGACFGIGLLSKYTIGLLGVAALLFMLIDPPSRRWLRRIEPYAGALLAAVIFCPVIVWNARNGWASFAFQTSRRLADRTQFALPKLLASVLVLLTPTGAAWAAWLLGRKNPPVSSAAEEESAQEQRRAWRFIQVTTLVPLAVFALFSLRHEVKLDWTGAAWIGAVPALAFGIVRGAEGAGAGFRVWMRCAWLPTLLVLLVVYGGGLYDLTLGIPGLGYGRHAELLPIGWRSLGSQIHGIAQGIEKQSGAAPLIVGMDRYAIASELAFYAPDQAKAVSETSSGHLFGQVGLMYERWFPVAAQQGRELLLVAWDPADLAANHLLPSVQSLGPIQDGVLMRDHDLIRRYYYRLAYAYRGLPAP